jgi:8-oxo-dGTP pyrophosphatase MutT (NUDIX family)
VDVIDDAGRTIGVVTRAEMRRRRLPHRSCAILVFSTCGRKLFIHQRTATKDVFPSHWDMAVGGVLAAGESFEEGARREFAEELGITAALQPLFPFRYSDDATIVQTHVFRTFHDGPFTLQPEEIVRGEFVALEDLPARIREAPFCPDGLAVWAQYQQTE